MQQYECTLRLRLTEDQITALPQPYRIESETRLDDGRERQRRHAASLLAADEP